ncbi:GrpB family protein [Neolewinella agarilytica]|uniref:GrpB domain, predicted nucleotidyltransferase, UPF0157 family n=1 Tax=Neolewinella agarilytica TaxID=478744 RepID=A0A1H9NII0_9BACT|nr:GrpB family protein [Neolewinella agarilytica]SER35718.1 GrpB domain, predicted nucleotidyltransferase, UPF0157 family [Neolewinella agarilytica]
MLILPYSPEWPSQFLLIGELLTTALGPAHLRIEHIGSTAVPGLAAKPIIDIDIVYAQDASLQAIIEALNSLGYFHNGDQGIPGREVFKRRKPSAGHPVLDQIQHHLYACPEGNPELRRHLLFRDYLRTNEEAREEYAQLKSSIATAAAQDRKQYAKLKEEGAREFVERVLAVAE